MIDKQLIEKAMLSVITAIGEDPAREGLKNTPKRIAQMYTELFSGLNSDPSNVLKTVFEEGHKELIVLKDLPFFSICEHHFLPFYGTASIGYVPSGRVVGASKLGRALDILAKRPQLQERLTDELVDIIFNTLRPDGVAAILSCEHLCMSLRGVHKPGTKIITSASRGSIRTNERERREFHALVEKQ